MKPQNKSFMRCHTLCNDCATAPTATPIWVLIVTMQIKYECVYTKDRRAENIIYFERKKNEQKKAVFPH